MKTLAERPAYLAPVGARLLSGYEFASFTLGKDASSHPKSLLAINAVCKARNSATVHSPASG
jgi:hypothetical protein